MGREILERLIDNQIQCYYKKCKLILYLDSLESSALLKTYLVTFMQDGKLHIEMMGSPEVIKMAEKEVCIILNELLLNWNHNKWEIGNE